MLVSTKEGATPNTQRSLALIAAIVAIVSGAFAFTAGWLTPHRLTPTKLVAALQPPAGPALGHRRNHAKGICFTGSFLANGSGAGLSAAKMLQKGEYPVVGRFNVAGGDPNIPDAMAAVHGIGFQISAPNGQQWRSAMIDAPVFMAPTPEAFYAFLTASASKDADAFKRYSSLHPEVFPFLAWAKNHPRTASWTQDRFNSLDSFVFTNQRGERYAVRWSLLPTAPPMQEASTRSANFLDEDIEQRVAASPQQWRLVVTIADPQDPTSDPTKAWPTDRPSVDVGTLLVRQIEPEVDGPCRDINFDPTVLPAGIAISDDPFPAARSAAYRVSYDERTAESRHYPHTQGRDKP